MTVDRVHVFEEDPLLRSNHYLHPSLAGHDRAHALSRRSSRVRLARLRELHGGHGDGPLDAAVLLRWLGDHGPPAATDCICKHGNGDPLRTETVGAVVMVPGERALWACPGPPCATPPERFQL